ncbi:MAG: K(+)/H(+) antiporter NhaP2 [Opitutia bacterium UBA7350]|nr:MAG: K(+)/H(+) antiporter NhaP2 [Opitutae bacterium UBA7350]
MEASHIAIADPHTALWTLCLAVGGGCLLTVLSRRLHLPTIVLLLCGGFALGPEGLNLLRPDALGHFLPVLVSLAVALILFEGGLTLDLKEFTQTSTVIQRLLSVGVVITWFGSALSAFVFLDTSPSYALLMGSLVIVTGPTVIVPLLRRIRLSKRVASILHWESVLIDSIGVFVAILCYEWVIEGGGAVALPNFIVRILSGATLGILGGYLIYYTMRRGWVPDNIVNAFCLAGAMLLFGITELVRPEAGLLSVTVAGLIIGINKPRQLREVKAFKAEIVDLLIGMLFLLLVARLEWMQFVSFYQNGGGWVLLSVIILVRPISVMASSWGTNLDRREKALLSWVAPRGVVAASMASLFALSLTEGGGTQGDPKLLESFVYSVICATVILQGLSSGLFARILGLQRPAPNDWVIIGAHNFGRELARHINAPDKQQDIIFLDSNARNAALARREGFVALHRDGMAAEELYEEEQALFGTGSILALTDNIELNNILMQRWAEKLGSEKVYGWIPETSSHDINRITGQSVFGDLARPSLISNELMQNESSFQTIIWNEETVLPTNDWHPLLVRRGRILRTLKNDAALQQFVRPGDEVICLKRSKGFLVRALQEGSFHNLQSTSLGALYSEIAQIADAQLSGVKSKVVIEHLEAQNTRYPACLGHGIAIPHVHCEGLEQRTCFVIHLSSGLPVPNQSDALQLIFFLMSPVDDTEGHLATLNDIAKNCRSLKTRDKLLAAKAQSEIIEAILTR